MTPLQHCLRLCLLISLAVAVTSAGWAQTTSPASKSNLSMQLLNAKIREVEATANIEETLKSTLIESYRQAQSNLEAETSNRATAANYAQQLVETPAKIKETRDFLESVKDKPELTATLDPKMPKSMVETKLVKEQANLAAVEAKLADIEKQLTDEKTRPTEARERLTEASTRLNSIAQELRVTPPEEEDPRLSEANQWNLKSENQALAEEIKMLDQELLSRQVRLDWLKAERDRANRSAQRMATTIASLEALNNEQRQQEAQLARDEAEAAKLEAIGKHPLLQQVAADNDTLSNTLQQATKALQQAKSQQKQSDDEIKDFEDEFKSAQLKLDIGGLSQALGQVMHEQRRSLPDVSSYQSATKKREQVIAQTGLDLINQQETRARLRDSDRYAKQLGAKLDPVAYTQIHQDLVSLLQQQSQLLDTTIKLNEDYIRSLGELEFTQRKLTKLITEYRSYLDQRLLWIRTAPTPNLSTLTVIPSELKKIFVGAGWLNSWEILVSGLIESVLYVLTIFLAVILIWRTNWLKARVDSINRKVASNENTPISQTLIALLLVILRAAPWPLLLWAMSMQLSQQANGHGLSEALALACHWAATPLFYLNAARIICRPGGVAAQHFGWPEPLLFEIEKSLTQLALALVPIGFIAVLMLFYSPIGMSGTLGRILLIAMMASVMIFFLRVFGPRSTILQQLLAFNPESKLVRRQYLWFLIALLVPALIFYLAVVGYAYTAGFLLGRLISTFLMVLVVTILHQVLMRWLGLVENKLPAMLGKIHDNMDQAPEQRETVDVEMLTSNSRTLINTAIGVTTLFALWSIWADVLPALSLLNEVALWNYNETVDNQLTRIPVTLADLGLAVLVATITVIATRTLPALLEIILIQLIRMPSGDRYTTLTLLRYIIVAVGFLSAANIIGGRWDQIQWLAAGLTVGIGFGLQEIVANFISGLIILFERPIRVGDKVTVGDTMGIVTKIRIRATTIQTWDRQELLVPNKEFITSRLLNWTLSDQTSRIQIKADVVHGTDPQQAMALMLEASAEHPTILKDPAAFVTMEGFSDNAIELNMRCYVGSFDDRLDASSSIYQKLNEKFKQAGIKIAAERRNLHFDDDKPLQVNITPDAN